MSRMGGLVVTSPVKHQAQPKLSPIFLEIHPRSLNSCPTSSGAGAECGQEAGGHGVLRLQSGAGRTAFPISVCRFPGHDRGGGKRVTPGSVKRRLHPARNPAASRAARSTTRVLAPPGHVTLAQLVASLWQDAGAAALEEPRTSELCPAPVSGTCFGGYSDLAKISSFHSKAWGNTWTSGCRHPPRKGLCEVTMLLVFLQLPLAIVPLLKATYHPPASKSGAIWPAPEIWNCCSD